MPQLGNSVEECVLTRWIKKPGEQVAAGDLVAEIETDKTTFEVTSPSGGTVLATFFEEGAVVPVFTTIFVVGSPGESVAAFQPALQGAAVRQGTAETVAPAQDTAHACEGRADGARKAAHAVAMSPRAARLAAELGVTPVSLRGSGPGGRVLERDVRRAHAGGARAGRIPEPRAASPRTAPPADEPDTTRLRATIARRMRESLASTAQYTLHASADATGLLALRARIKARASEGLPDITLNDLVTFCAIQALLEMPALNAEYIDGRVVRHEAVHIAFAVDTPRGLIAPVVRHAQDLSIAELSLRMKRLTVQALDGTIAPDDLGGATFTISNLGALGVESFTPVLNPPQVAILGVDAITLRAVRRPAPQTLVRLRETSARRATALAEAIEFVDSLGLSMTCDHQVIDGAPAARFLQLLRQKIEGIEAACDI